MIGILTILICWAIGELITMLLGGYISGNIIGMFLLYLALHFKIVKPQTIAPTAKFLLASMALFFIPFGVGLINSYTIIIDHWFAIAMAAIISTLAVIAITALVYIILRK